MDEAIRLALGRIFGMMQRPGKPGDVAEYERCRALILDHAEGTESYEHNWARDRLKGAQGDA